MDTLSVDMTAYWKPTRESYLNHVTKARICDVVTSAVSAEAAAPLASMKKDEAAQTAERLLTGTNWLPEVLANREHAKVSFYGATHANHDSDDDEEGDDA